MDWAGLAGLDGSKSYGWVVQVAPKIHQRLRSGNLDRWSPLTTVGHR